LPTIQIRTGNHKGHKYGSRLAELLRFDSDQIWGERPMRFNYFVSMAMPNLKSMPIGGARHSCRINLKKLEAQDYSWPR
jgi:hypothetical protein